MVVPEETLHLLNRAMLVAHNMRTAAHELNNVFQMIRGSAELLDSNPALAPELKPRLDAVRRQAMRGEALVRAVADLARHEPVQTQPVDVRRIVDHVLKTRRFEHERARLTVATDAAADASWLVLAHPVGLEQILLSLVINAEQAVADRGEGGAVTIALTRDPKQIDIHIRDNGPGGNQGRGAIQDEAFGSFVTTKDADVAAGLGLPAARLLTARFGGEVDLTVSDEGGVARVRLPAAEALLP